MRCIPQAKDLWVLSHGIDKKLVESPVQVKVAKHYYNGDFATSLGIVEQPLTYKSRVWEVYKESLEKDLTN